MTFLAVPWLVASSLRVSVVILLVLCLRSTLRRWIGSRAVAWLWLAIVARLLFPLPAAAPWHVPTLLTAPRALAAASPFIFRVSVSPAGTPADPDTALPRRSATLPPAAPAPNGLFLVWLAGASLAAARLGRAWWITRCWAAHIPADIHPDLTSIYRALPARLRRGVTLRLTDALDVPALVGVFHPQIWLPRTLPDTLTPAELRHVLLHELGHAHRRDLLTQWLCELACCLHWFNPLVWLLTRVARTDRELACDAWVLSRDPMRAETPTSYGHTLLKVVEGMRHRAVRTLLVVSMAAGKRHLGLRVREIRAFRPVAPWRGVAALVVTMALVAACTLGNAAAVAAGGVVASSAPVAAASPSPAPTAPVSASPVPAASVPPASGPSARPRQVEIESKFIEVAKSTALQLEKSAPRSSPLASVYHQLFARFAEQGLPAAPTIFRSALVLPGDFQIVVRQLNQAKGVDLLSAPRVTTKSGQKATIEIVREFIYPTAFQRDQGPSGKPGATPTSFDKKNTGVTLEVAPTIEPNGNVIDLSLTWTITNLDGFVDADGKPIPAGKEESVMKFPVFDTRSVSSVANLSSGATVMFSRNEEHLFFRKSIQSVMGETKRKVSPAKDDDRLLLVFVTATLVDPPPAAPAGTGDEDAIEEDAQGKNSAAGEAKDKAVLEHKLAMVIPRVAFHAERLSDALELLRAEAQRLDTAEINPENRGINIFLKRTAPTPAAPGAATATTGTSGKVDPSGADGSEAALPDNRINDRVTLDLSQRPLREILDAVAAQVGMKVKVERFAVSIVPLTEATERLITAQFSVAPAVLGALSAEAVEGTVPNSRLDARPWLNQKGLTFPVGSSATYLPASQKLVVRSTEKNIERLKALFPSDSPTR